ncbi:DUF1929-domain-containing protein [Ceraceosorus guamensis]|uniref:DUF1929-domain-containing protein n=1 Tax=Ceraceosorus guamensis TaxID=1522189 RepID=A0A316W2M0_9BASI|nr:DUF1929-domain-containing protein [Ceraceosorus guamensis]PWN44020.1 DUF1929-domain-containing protein [Ceraceosorus guamensis]
MFGSSTLRRSRAHNASSSGPSTSSSTRRMMSTLAAGCAAMAMVATGVSAEKSAGQYDKVLDNSLASAMMLVLVNENTVAVIDKVENNTDKLDNTDKPVWASLVDLEDFTPRGVDITTNTFCASGAHLGNGSLLVAGGNQAIQGGGAALAQGQDPMTGPYKDTDGRKALRIMEHSDTSANLEWVDSSLFMSSARWYPGIETLADGSILLIGGATGGGYINRNTPNTDPAFQGGSIDNLDAGGSNPTYEFFPPRPNDSKQISQFMVTTSGLNMYPHTFLMPSGLLFMQANYSTTLWNFTDNTETALAEMPNQVVRVYPASGATAMLPLTPDNNYTPTILFCGGATLSDYEWGNYTAPTVNILQREASKDCSSITPEDANGKQTGAGYVHEEDLPQGRTMGQFIHLPDETMVIVNGANKGTAGYSNQSWTQTTFNGQPLLTEGMSADPTYQPVLWDGSKPKGQRLTTSGFGLSSIARLYHSSAILLPDASVLIAGSNPHQDVSLTMPIGSSPQGYNTTYEMEKWYPPYYFKDRPQPQGLPSFILYGGSTWKFKIDANFMGANDAANYRAEHTKVMVIRGGFSTHAMNMGQRSMRLQHTYTVNDDGSVDFEVMPMPQNQNVFVAGPALLFITVDGVPSLGKYIQIGSRSFSGPVPTTYQTGSNPSLPQAKPNSKYTKTPPSNAAEEFGIGKIVGIAVGAAAIIALILLGLCCWRRSAKRGGAAGAGAKRGAAGAAGAGGAIYGMNNYANGGRGGEYKRVDTPNPGMHSYGGNLGARASMGTFDSYGGSIPGTPGQRYFDNPGAGQREPLAPSPLAQPSHSPNPAGQYQQQGWGEHQASGDVGEQYYHNGGYSDPSQYYDQPSQHGSRNASGYSQGQGQHQQSYSQQHDYFRSES